MTEETPTFEGPFLDKHLERIATMIDTYKGQPMAEEGVELLNQLEALKQEFETHPEEATPEGFEQGAPVKTHAAPTGATLIEVD